MEVDFWLTHTFSLLSKLNLKLGKILKLEKDSKIIKQVESGYGPELINNKIHYVGVKISLSDVLTDLTFFKVNECPLASFILLH